QRSESPTRFRSFPSDQPADVSRACRRVALISLDLQEYPSGYRDVLPESATRFYIKMTNLINFMYNLGARSVRASLGLSFGRDRGLQIPISGGKSECTIAPPSP